MSTAVRPLSERLERVEEARPVLEARLGSTTTAESSVGFGEWDRLFLLYRVSGETGIIAAKALTDGFPMV